MARPLPPNSTPEALRKAAKRWLKGIREGDADAMARLQAAWPKAPAAPGLREVQHALARNYGQTDWPTLIAEAEARAVDRLSAAERAEVVLRHAWDGDLLVARRILSRHPDVAGASLFTATVCGDTDAVRRRLAADPSLVRATGGSLNWTALTYAAYGRLDPVNAVEIATLLLDAGADPNFQFDDGWGSPFKVLTGPIRLGERNPPSHAQADALVELLIARGADPYDLQALYNTSISGDDLHWLSLLWDHCEAQGSLARWREIGEGNLGSSMGVNTLDYLLGNAVGSYYPKRAAWLLEHGADPNARQAYQRLRVHTLARLSGFSDIAALLERHGAEPEILQGAMAFRAALLAHEADKARQMASADPSLAIDPSQILAAAGFGDAEAVDLLLSLGASATSADGENITPLHRAVQSGDQTTADKLIAAGAEIDAIEDHWGGTPLGWSLALHRPHMSVRLAPLSRDVRNLCGLGLVERIAALVAAEPELARRRSDHPRHQDGPTPLFCLPDDEETAETVAQLLLAAGADPAAANDKGETAIVAARRRGLDGAADRMEQALRSGR